MTTNDIDAIRMDASRLVQLLGRAGDHPAAVAFRANDLASVRVPALCDEIEQLRAELNQVRDQSGRYAHQRNDLAVELEKVRGQLTDTRHRADGYANDLRSLQHGHDTYANENQRLKNQIAKAREIAAALDKTDEANAHAGNINAQYHGYGARILYATENRRCDCCYAYGTTQPCGLNATTEMTVHPFGILAVNDACKARINGTSDKAEVAR